MPEQLSLFGPARPAGVLVARGARAAEGVLFGLVEPLLAEAAKDPRLLARPVRIVVPSRSLRLHVTSALVRRLGRAVAGVSVETLHGLALGVLERAGERLPVAGHLFDLLAERFAREEPELRRGLDSLVDGYAAAVGSVRDLLDAGLEPVLAEAADEALATDGQRVATRAELERARALVRVAAATDTALRELGAGRSSTLLRRAAELLAQDPDTLPCRAVLVHGFADATGVAADLIEALLRLPGARLVLDRPPAPGGEDPRAVERAFTERLATRLAVHAREEVAGPAPELAAVRRLEAAGTDAEVRAVALAARAAIDAGARPEGIAIAARDLAPYGPALARHLARLGVPFSGLGAHGSPGSAERRTRAAAELLRRGEEAPCDLWLDALLPPAGASGPFGAARFDVRLALNALGAGRLRDAAALDLERALVHGDYPLPIRQGLGELPADDEDGEDEAGKAGARRATRPRRRVEGAVLGRAVAAARRLVRRLEGWPEEAPFGEHLRRLRALLEDDLGWCAAAGATPLAAEPALAVVAALAREIPAEMGLSRAELRLVATRALAAAAEPGLGGEGGGVQVLSVMETRGRTFDHLFVVGLNRDQFPRAVREDPLLSDELRRVLARVLPDVPLKARGFDEERYLFAQLLSAAPAVTLSWQSADEDGKARPPSPLLAALGPAEPAKAPPLWALPDRTDDRAGGLLRPADEHAVLAALHGGRTRFSRSLPLAMAEARRETPDLVLPLDPAAIGRFRAAVLDEADPDLRTPEGRAAAVRLGPWLGLTGRRGEGDLWVTLLEGLSGCPWRTFVSRVLRIEPTPDPLATLPGIDARLVGTLVHAVLEAIVREAAPDLPRTLPEVQALLAAGRQPALVAWPEPAALERLLAREAERVSREAGIALSGMARALAERARPFLEVARREDWAQPLPVVGVEVEGTVEVAGPAGLTVVAFKADRVDLVAGEDGRPVLRLTDYKSGRPPGSGGPEARRRRFLAEVAAGARLQAAAYRAGAGTEAVGRYLFLPPDADDEAREITIRAGDEEAGRAFAEAAGVALGAWEAGAFIPRLVEPGGDHTPRRCASCEVAEACILGDSGARRRLLAWAEQGEEAGVDAAAALAVWRLGAPERGEGAGEVE